MGSMKAAAASELEQGYEGLAPRCRVVVRRAIISRSGQGSESGDRGQRADPRKSRAENGIREGSLRWDMLGDGHSPRVVLSVSCQYHDGARKRADRVMAADAR